MSALEIVFLVILGIVFLGFLIKVLFFSTVLHPLYLMILICLVFVGLYFTVWPKIYQSMSQFLNSIIPPMKSQDEFRTMDDIWYFLLMIHLLLVVAFLVKSLKTTDDSNMRLAGPVLGSFIILFLYTLIYYVIRAYDIIDKVVLYLTVIVLISVLFVIITSYVIEPLRDFAYVCLGFVSFIYIFCLLVFLHKGFHSLISYISI